MSFQLTCPNCGKRPVGEFTFRGFFKSRPQQSDEFEKWAEYIFFNPNRMGKQKEWWYHAAGCQRWFVVERDSTNNTDHQSVWFDQRNTLSRQTS